MRLLGTLPVFLFALLLCAGMFMAGIQAAAAPAGAEQIDRGTGFVLIFLAIGLFYAARKARAEYSYRQGIGKLSEWAQGLSPDKRKGRRK